MTSLSIGVTPKTIKAARDVIFEILKASNGDPSVTVEALRTFRDICAVNGTSISHCSFGIATKRAKSK